MLLLSDDHFGLMAPDRCQHPIYNTLSHASQTCQCQTLPLDVLTFITKLGGRSCAGVEFQDYLHN